jgi:hypothetical protein
MNTPENPNSSEFEQVAQTQADETPFPGMTNETARNSSLFLAAALVLPIIGILVFAFETSRLLFGFITTAVLAGVWLAYFLILHGIFKRRGEM